MEAFEAAAATVSAKLEASLGRLVAMAESADRVLRRGLVRSASRRAMTAAPAAAPPPAPEESGQASGARSLLRIRAVAGPRRVSREDFAPAAAAAAAAAFRAACSAVCTQERAAPDASTLDDYYATAEADKEVGLP